MPRVYVVGCGLAGLACAVRLAGDGVPVTVFEAAERAGGRCRSFFDSKLQCEIDNGNHILMSANVDALDYLNIIEARDTLIWPDTAEFAFTDLKTGQRWTVRPNHGKVPWWVFAPGRRIPDVKLREYWSIFRLASANRMQSVSECVGESGELFRRFWIPLTNSVMNTSPHEASARLLWSVLRKTFVLGEEWCRPLVVREGLSATFVDPALRFLRRHRAEIHFRKRLRGIESTAAMVNALQFADHRLELREDDIVVIAVPASTAAGIDSGLSAPTETRPILNAHVRIPNGAVNARDTAIIGVVGGITQWIFIRGDVVSVTASSAEAVINRPNFELERDIWKEIADVLELDPRLPHTIRIIKERNATIAHTPYQLGLRHAAETSRKNMFLAGDWTDTGLPATLDGAIRSGYAAARKVSVRLRKGVARE